MAGTSSGGSAEPPLVTASLLHHFYRRDLRECLYGQTPGLWDELPTAARFTL